MNERFKARLCFFLYMLMLILFNHEYKFMLLNMFLAFAALELSFLLPLFRAGSKREIPAAVLFYLVFILLSPNVFYVVTDLIHLNIFAFNYEQGVVFTEWWNFFVLTSGVLLAIFYYILMIKQVNYLLLNLKWRKPILLVGIVLYSIGIYIGRFLRFHSIHLFTEPFSLFKQFLSSLTGNAVLFIAWMSILQFMICWLFLDLRRVRYE